MLEEKAKMQMLKTLYLCTVYMLFSIGEVMGVEPMESVSGSPQANNFSLTSVNGSKVTLEDYRGKFVLLNFWATWCAPCRKEMPSMDNLQNQLGDRGLDVVGVHVGPSLAGVKKFLQSVPVNFTILIDKDMGLASWGVRGLPTTYLINPEGKLIYKATGEREWDSPEMIKFLDALIVSYERMASKEPVQPKEQKSFFANIKETFGLRCEHKNSTNQLHPN